MSEEEIIDNIKDSLKKYYGEDVLVKINILKEFLDLYQKEKEKNKKLVDMAETLRKENVELLITNRQMDLHYISKDKIKELLKEIQKEKDIATKEFLEKDYHMAENGAISQELGYVEGKIQELLGEE